jgi:hypothetical protein
MSIWTRKRYEEEKRRFIQRRVHLAPLWGQFTIVFGISWAAAWFCSWFLLRYFAAAQPWLRDLPSRYAIAFLFAYACFFLAVRLWIEMVRHEPPEQQAEQLQVQPGVGVVDGEGCLIVFVVLAVSFIVGGLILAFGGAPMLLEVAFEAAFAGVVVRRPLSGDLVLGDWKICLLKNTWKQALTGIVLLVGLAAWLQSQAPQASTFAQAVRQIVENGKG